MRNMPEARKMSESTNKESLLVMTEIIHALIRSDPNLGQELTAQRDPLSSKVASILQNMTAAAKAAFRDIAKIDGEIQKVNPEIQKIMESLGKVIGSNVPDITNDLRDQIKQFEARRANEALVSKATSPDNP